jgi:hypothetical protein
MTGLSLWLVDGEASQDFSRKKSAAKFSTGKIARVDIYAAIVSAALPMKT